MMTLLYIGDTEEGDAFAKGLAAHLPDIRVMSAGGHARMMTLLDRARPDVIFIDLEEPDVALDEVLLYCRDEIVFAIAAPDTQQPARVQGLFEFPLDMKRVVDVLRPINAMRKRNIREKILLNAQQTSSNGIAIVSHEGDISYVNAAFCGIIGMSPGMVRTQTIRQLFSETAQQKMIDEAQLSIAEGNQCWVGTVSGKRRHDNRPYTAAVTVHDCAALTGDLNSSENYFLLELREITEEIRLEADLQHSQRIESIGRLAGGISHDFNNMLQGLLGFIELMEIDYANPIALHDDIRQSRAIIVNAQKLTAQLLAFSRKQAITPVCFDLNAYLKEHEPIFPRLLGSNLNINLNLSPSLPPIFADLSQIEQCLINLLINARDAVDAPNTPHITIATEVVALNQEQLAQKQLPGLPGQFVALSVEDNGRGIPDALMSKIFDPFFTTKEKGKGSGLGLSVIFGILKQLKGTVEVTQTSSKGTIFTLYFPPFARLDTLTVVKDEEPVVEKVVPSVQVRQRGADVLVVEDSPILIRLAEQCLQAQGYTVYTATTEQEALKVYGEHSKEIGILFTDIILEEGNGIHLADTIRQMDPGLPVLLTSGFSRNFLQDRSLSYDRFCFLPKPYTRDIMLHAIEEARQSS